MIPPDKIAAVRMLCLMLVAMSVFLLVRPDKFGLRVGLTRYKLPNSPWAYVAGGIGLVWAGGLFLATLFPEAR